MKPIYSNKDNQKEYNANKATNLYYPLNNLQSQEASFSEKTNEHQDHAQHYKDENKALKKDVRNLNNIVMNLTQSQNEVLEAAKKILEESKELKVAMDTSLNKAAKLKKRKDELKRENTSLNYKLKDLQSTNTVSVSNDVARQIQKPRPVYERASGERFQSSIGYRVGTSAAMGLGAGVGVAAAGCGAAAVAVNAGLFTAIAPVGFFLEGLAAVGGVAEMAAGGGAIAALGGPVVVGGIILFGLGAGLCFGIYKLITANSRNERNKFVDSVIHSTSGKDLASDPKALAEASTNLNYAECPNFPGIEYAMRFIIMQLIPAIEDLLYGWRTEKRENVDQNISNNERITIAKNAQEDRIKALRGGHDGFIRAMLSHFITNGEFSVIAHRSTVTGSIFRRMGQSDINSINSAMLGALTGVKLKFQKQVIEDTLFSLLDVAVKVYKAGEAEIRQDDLVAILGMPFEKAKTWKDSIKETDIRPCATESRNAYLAH